MNRNLYINKGIALFLAFWMLFASIGFSVDFHYCEGEIVDWSLIGNADKCDHENEIIESEDCCSLELISTCHDDHSKAKEIEISNCCSTGNASCQLENDFEFISLNTGISPLLVILTASFVPVNIIVEKEITIFYTNSSPPILSKQGLSYTQSFLL